MEKRGKSTAPKDEDGPKPQKQWDIPPGERTSDPEQQQVERVQEEERKKREGNAHKPSEEKSVLKQSGDKEGSSQKQ